MLSVALESFTETLPLAQVTLWRTCCKNCEYERQLIVGWKLCVATGQSELVVRDRPTIQWLTKFPWHDVQCACAILFQDQVDRNEDSHWLLYLMDL
jgi:hypothetical protein